MMLRKATPLAGLLIAAAMTVGAAGPASAGSPGYCQGYAHEYATYYSAGGGNVLGSALGGGLIGGAIGSLSGDFGAGAAIGAGIGTLAGLAGKSQRYQQLHAYAYNWCLSH